MHLNPGPQYRLNQTNEGLINTFSSLKSQTNLEVLIRHVNVRGLRNNLSHVKVLLEYSALDILAITESNLSSNVGDLKVNIDGYRIERKDRNHK